jgi:HK97 family phage major capsid protein
MYLSRRLQLQNGVALENVLRNDLAFVLAQALDAAAINGLAANKQPVGILNAIAETVTASPAFISDTTADLIAALELDDVTGTTGFLTNKSLMGQVRKVKTLGRVIPVSELFHGEKVVSTNQVPKVGGKDPLIFGAWSNLLIGYWSGVDILLNPYSDASKGGLRMHAFLDADIAVRHNEAFAWTSTEIAEDQTTANNNG